MSDYTTQWTETQFHAYVLLYCAHADLIETEDESDTIRSLVSPASYQIILDEYEADNDYVRIQKIQHTAQRMNYGPEKVDELLASMKEVFMADGHFEAEEQLIFMGLKRLLR